MGTVVRDWRLIHAGRRKRSARASGGNTAGALCVGHELHTAPVDLSSEHRTRWRIALVLASLSVLATWTWWLGAEQRAVRALAPAERAVVFERTLRDFEDLCRPPRSGLEQHCRHQASFLMSFPECDEHCHALTRPILQWRS